MDTAIRLANKLRTWATNVFENGPTSFRKKAAKIISSCDEFIKEYDRNIEHLLSSRLANKDVTIHEAHKIMQQALFLTYGELRGLECNLLPKVLRLCVEANIKAPEGWHGRLVVPTGLKNKDAERAKIYRKRFLATK
jgi:hypothetical protein